MKENKSIKSKVHKVHKVEYKNVELTLRTLRL